MVNMDQVHFIFSLTASLNFQGGFGCVLASLDIVFLEWKSKVVAEWKCASDEPSLPSHCKLYVWRHEKRGEFQFFGKSVFNNRFISYTSHPGRKCAIRVQRSGSVL